MQGKKLILFDLSEVLIGGLVGIEHAIASREGCTPQQATSIIAGDALWDLCRGRIEECQYFERICSDGAWKNTSFVDFQQIARSLFERIVPGMPEYVAELAAKHELCLLSDHAREWVPHIERTHSFLRHFKRRTYSYDLHAVKKDGIPFQHVLDECGYPPQDIAFIDDSRTNIAVASERGFQTFLFRGLEPLKPELTAWLGNA